MDSDIAVIYDIEHLASQLAKQSDQILQEQLGIGYAQFKILQFAQQNPSLRQLDAAHQLGQTEASISRQIKLLAASGLIQQSGNPTNRRERRASLTAKGERLTSAASAALEKYYASALESLGNKRHSQLAAALAVLHDQLCASDHQPVLEA
jgi:DNA-binding MarR family transcriptional regulator